MTYRPDLRTFHCSGTHQHPHSFPTRRSSDLMQGEQNVGDLARKLQMSQPAVSHHLRTLRNLHLVRIRKSGRTSLDRKSTRLNSSHVSISYAVFCLKKNTPCLDSLRADTTRRV